jgi:hypothetical protein
MVTLYSIDIYDPIYAQPVKSTHKPPDAAHFLWIGRCELDQRILRVRTGT